MLMGIDAEVVPISRPFRQLPLNRLRPFHPPPKSDAQGRCWPPFEGNQLDIKDIDTLFWSTSTAIFPQNR